MLKTYYMKLVQNLIKFFQFLKIKRTTEYFIMKEIDPKYTNAFYWCYTKNIIKFLWFKSCTIERISDTFFREKARLRMKYLKLSCCNTSHYGARKFLKSYLAGFPCEIPVEKERFEEIVEKFDENGNSKTQGFV